MLWEYCSLVALTHNTGQANQTWSIVLWGNGARSQKLYGEEGVSEFDRVYWLNLLGLRGWELVDTIVERVIFPGYSLGLDRDNQKSQPHSYRFTFKRPVQRQPSAWELAELARVGVP